MSVRIVIIGAGPGGYTAAFEAARLGAAVTLVEREKAGGVCLHWGCVPTKTWKTAADSVETLRRASAYGITVPGEPRIDLDRLLTHQRAVVENLERGIHAHQRKYGVRYMEGKARLESSRRVRIQFPDGGSEEIEGDRLILAPGSSPLPCPGLPFDSVRVISTSDAVRLAAVPRSVLIVGGGVNGCEFASILASLGVKVTIVEALSRLLTLPSIDAASSAVIEREMRKRNIEVILNHTVEEVTFPGGKIVARVVPFECRTETSAPVREPMLLETDLVLATAGRSPNTADLGLYRAGIETDTAGWILADDRLETNIPGVYAIGDILGPGKSMLAHTAAAEGVIAARNALGARERMDYRAIPVGVFTTPEIAGVGLTEAGARETVGEVRTALVHLRSLGRAQAMGEIAGQVKIVADSRGKILGVHIAGAHATELIAEASLALKLGASAEDLASTIHAHPTLSEALREAAEELRFREPL